MSTDKTVFDKLKWFAWAIFCLGLDIFLSIHFKWDAPAWQLIAGYMVYLGCFWWLAHEVGQDTDGQAAPGFAILLAPTGIIVAALLTTAELVK